MIAADKLEIKMMQNRKLVTGPVAPDESDRMRRFFKTPEVLILLVSLWIAFTCNVGYWRVIAENSPHGGLPTLAFLVSFLLLTVGLIGLVMLIFVVGRLTRLVLGLALLVASSAGYFTAKYGVLFDTGMLVNVIETNRAEAFELVSPSLIAVITIFGLIPATVIWHYPLTSRRFPTALLHRSIAVFFALGLIAGPLYASQKEVFSVTRNHHELRHMIAPLNVFSASYIYARYSFEAPTAFKQVAQDATHVSAALEGQRPSVHVLIVGETARAANFGLNGYALNTNPELTKHEGIHFLEAASCGTATAVSLPCMFSIQSQRNFVREESRNSSNLLDIVARSGYEVYWIDNGNGCKGICSRVNHRDVHAANVNLICPEGECFDEILVVELENILSSVTSDTFIVLHQLGSHGPAYFRRYPETSRLFQPDCRSPNFGDCSDQEISNSYDNTIAYTDHVIATAIDTLSTHSDDINGSLIYVSDHGESLGEHGLYLHGMPYNFAPEEQTRVPIIAWLSTDVMRHQLIESNCDLHEDLSPMSHDNIFHTELGLMGIKTAVYLPELDIFSSCRIHNRETDAFAAT